MRLIKVLGSDAHRRSLDRYNCTESAPRFGVFVLLHGSFRHMQSELGEIIKRPEDVFCGEGHDLF